MEKQEIDVIVLEDDLDLCMMIETLLKFSGLTVLKTTNPDALLEKLNTYAPRLILSDMLLSGYDGRDLCRKLKGSNETKHIKIMMASAHPDAETTCLEAGADTFLAKPFDMDDLIGRTKKLIGQA